MSQNQVIVRVRRPAPVVYDRIASHSWTNEPAWEPEVLGVQPDDGGLRVGGRVAMTRRDFGKVATTTYEITALEPGRRLAVRHLDGPMNFALEFLVTPASTESADVRVTVDIGLRGAMRLMTPVFAVMSGRQTARIAAQMAEAIEASAAASPVGDSALATT